MQEGRSFQQIGCYRAARLKIAIEAVRNATVSLLPRHFGPRPYNVVNRNSHCVTQIAHVAHPQNPSRDGNTLKNISAPLPPLTIENEGLLVPA